ncbi:guanylate cyclase [Plakobranchus ocellatus]|uniref:Guanylate cyclase n=1 Tax=Plakobranchus ocellatus TaxID=259542 RepID=A0AAV4A5I8_9GAST|nr:guanylate cyclase [Plakobranchus ocellatus]
MYFILVIALSSVTLSEQVPYRFRTIIGDPEDMSDHTAPQEKCEWPRPHRLYPNTVQIGVILPYSGDYPWGIKMALPAIILALENVTNDSDLLRGLTVHVNVEDSDCSETIGPLAAINMYINQSADVFFGPACAYSVAPVARFSKFWGIPVLSAGALVAAFKDKTEYRLLTRVQGTHAKVSEFVLQLFKSYSWSHAALLYNDVTRSPNSEKRTCYFSAEAIFLDLLEYFGRRPYNKRFDERSHLVDYAELLKGASSQARVIVLCASPDSVREIMIKAHELNFDNGEYVFFNIDLFSSQNTTSQPWYRADDTEQRNADARVAYESLMTVTLRKPTGAEYRKFSEDVKERAAQMYENFTFGEQEVNSFVGAFYDAVILYALALNETLEAGGNVSDGLNITRRMWNRTFTGITGTVSIDSNGDRNADYSLLDLNPETESFEVVANYFGNSKEYTPYKGRMIHWAGGRKEPPPDVPKCGFDGSKCPPKAPFPGYAIMTIVLVSILIIVLIITFFVYRHYRQEAELAEMNWRVRWEDILFSGPMRSDRRSERGSSQKDSYRSDCSDDTIAVHLNDVGNRQLFTRTGYYKVPP